MKATAIFSLNALIICCIALFSSSHVMAKDNTGIMDKYETKKIAEHTWAVFGPKAEPNPENQGFMNNPLFVVTDNSVVVIDPGSSLQVGQALLAKIKKLTNNPITHVFNSHVHGDHWLGNQAIQKAYPEVKIYAHPEMISEAKAGEAENWISLMNTLTKGATEGTKAVIPANSLQDGQEITVDNITIKAHLSEVAHTKTDAMFEIIQDKVLVTGDNNFNGRMPRLDDGSYVGNLKALDRGLKLDVEVVVPGHGPSGGKEVLNNFHDFLSIIYFSSKTLMEEDIEPFEMKPIIVKKLEKFQHWVNFDSSIGKLISLAVLEAENE